MDFGPLIASPVPLQSSHNLNSFYSNCAAPEASIMIIDTSIHNSTMPDSPKQGETIAADSLSEQQPQLIPPSTTSTTWRILSLQQKSTLPTTASVAHTESKIPLSSSFTSSPAQVKPDKDSIMVTDSFDSDTHCDSWTGGKDGLKSILNSSPESSSIDHLLSSCRNETESIQLEELNKSTKVSTSAMLTRNCDQPDSSPSPQAQFTCSLFEPEQSEAEVTVHNSDSFTINKVGVSVERRSRRKPTIGDIIRRVQPAVEAPVYDSEESEIEDDILQDEMMANVNHGLHTDEFEDGLDRSRVRSEDDRMYKDDVSRQLNVDHLSRLEAVDGMPEEEEDEDMEIHSESDSITDSDKHAFLNDVPESIYNLMREAKVKAHTMFMKTVGAQSHSESKVSRERYLLELLSNLRDKCLEEDLKPEIIGPILKDVENDVTYFSEYLEDMKMRQFFLGSDKESCLSQQDINNSHFLSRPIIKVEDDIKDRNESSGLDSLLSSIDAPPFLHLSSSSSPVPTSSCSSLLPSSDSKPVIVTVSADIKSPPSLMYSQGGLPLQHQLTSSISDQTFNSMFLNGKLSPWYPPMFNFSPSGTFDLPHKLLNLDGRVSDNLDKDYLKCQFCERTFRRQKNLENHIENTHQGKGTLKPRREASDMYFKCSHCPYTTKHQSNLYVHLRIHTGERPYICGACGVQYSQSHSLKSHIINKHDGIMSYYIKEKRTRSPRVNGYLTAQVMHSDMFKFPGLVTGSPMHHSIDFVSNALELTNSENARNQQHHLSSPDADINSRKSMMPPPLSSIISNGNNSTSCNNSSSQSGNVKSSGPLCGLGNGSIFSPPGANTHPPFFMNGNTLMFGDLPSHMHNTNHAATGLRAAAHPFLPGYPHFPSNSSTNFHGSKGFPQIPGLSPNSSPVMSTSSTHHSLTHLQSRSDMSSSPTPHLQQIKKEPGILASPNSSKLPSKILSEEAIDLRKKSPPLDMKEELTHDLTPCGGKENCPHAAKLKYLRLNVVRMLGILVPNLNFAEKGISAESESVDELLQDVIESNSNDEDITE